MAEVHEQLKATALSLGFDLVGIARVESQAPHYDQLQRWLRHGMHGEMAFLERNNELRRDPRLLLPNCRSLVCVAMSYHTSLLPSWELTDPDRVWVSRYAWGRDYHRLLKRRLIRLGRWLAARHPGISWRASVDTAPVLERSWAALAGLGWIGRSTMLINQRLGSELFLGALLTDLELPADTRVSPHCGRCTACIDICPTGALLARGNAAPVLDARRCIAYLTVEHRSSITEELHPKMDVMVAGCDLCQEVCPFTRHASADLHPEFAPAPHRLCPRFEDMNRLSEQEYRQWRTASPLGRISYAQMRRNLEIARVNMDKRIKP